MDNPVYHLRYLRDRMLEQEEKAVKYGLKWPPDKQSDLSLLDARDEQELMLQVFKYPTILDLTDNKMEPHRLVLFIERMAECLHNYYTYHSMVNPKNIPLSSARLLLVETVRRIMDNAFRMLGITLGDEG